jgi:septum formation protein
MLEKAGVPALVDPARIDEEELTAAMQAEGLKAAEVAEALAELKAQRVSPRHAGWIVLGCDQMLECDGRWFTKPETRAKARAQLQALAGKTHELVSCVVAVRDGARLWHKSESAKVTLRPLSDSFIDGYLERAGDAVLHCAGTYQIEGLGPQLFARTHGDFFTIQGLPLLPLLEFLRAQNLLPR